MGVVKEAAVSAVLSPNCQRGVWLKTLGGLGPEAMGETRALTKNDRNPVCARQSLWPVPNTLFTYF